MFDRLGSFINGKWYTDGAEGCDVINPATEEGLGRLPYASAQMLDQSIETPDAAFAE